MHKVLVVVAITSAIVLERVAETPDLRAIPGRRVQQGRKGLRAYKGSLVLRAQPARKGPRVRKGQRVTRAIEANPRP